MLIVNRVFVVWLILFGLVWLIGVVGWFVIFCKCVLLFVVMVCVCFLKIGVVMVLKVVLLFWRWFGIVLVWLKGWLLLLCCWLVLVWVVDDVDLVFFIGVCDVFVWDWIDFGWIDDCVGYWFFGGVGGWYVVVVGVGGLLGNGWCWLCWGNWLCGFGLFVIGVVLGWLFVVGKFVWW